MLSRRVFNCLHRRQNFAGCNPLPAMHVKIHEKPILRWFLIDLTNIQMLWLDPWMQ